MNYRKSFWLMWALCVAGLLLLYLFVAVGQYCHCLCRRFMHAGRTGPNRSFPPPLLRQLWVPAGGIPRSVRIAGKKPLTDTDRPGQRKKKPSASSRRDFLMLENAVMHEPENYPEYKPCLAASKVDALLISVIVQVHFVAAYTGILGHGHAKRCRRW